MFSCHPKQPLVHRDNNGTPRVHTSIQASHSDNDERKGMNEVHHV